MEDADWDRGLPPDILALVAKSGGMASMTVMRGVSKSWQRGYELGVTSLKICLHSPMLPPGETSPQRFPYLASLDLGGRPVEEQTLQALKAFPKLRFLTLGLAGNAFQQQFWTSAITDTHLAALRGTPLTSLTLDGCRGITPEGLAHLQGMPLAALSLGSCKGVLTDGGVAALRGLPLTSLNLEGIGIEGLSDAGLAILGPGTPPLGPNSPLMEPPPPLGGVPTLGGFPLRSLNLGGSKRVTDSGLEKLRGLPLTHLALWACDRLTDAGLEHLRGMPLTQLSLNWNAWLSEAGLRHLRGLPLVELDLSFCWGLSDGCLLALGELGLPLRKLNLGYCRGWRMTRAGLEHLRGQSLTSLDISRCDWVGDSGLEALGEMA